MRLFVQAFFLLLMALLFAMPLHAQDDENRQASGLPRLIGAPGGTTMSVSGRIVLETNGKLAKAPIIAILINVAGVPFVKTIARDTGHYFIQGVPRQAATVIVEVDGVEVGRQNIIASPTGNSTIDMRVPWPMATGPAQPGVISASSLFSRSEKNEKLFAEAIAAGKAGQTAKAVDLFNQILSDEPKDFVAWTELGTVYFRADSLDNAEAGYFKAIELKQDYFAALLNLGKLYLTRKKFDEAILVLTNAVNKDPESAEARHYLGESYLQAKKGSLAVPQLNEAIRLAPKEKAELHLRLAALYDGAGLKSKAAMEYRMFLEKRPDHADKKKLEKYIADNPPK
ncbi:MAG: tetratricopeptide repeat protein [Pyrinomonadaceae bacterium]